MFVVNSVAPMEIPAPATLLEIAAGAGSSENFRFLLEFWGMPVTPEAMRQALAKDLELAHDVWVRLPPEVQETEIVEFARTAAECNNRVAVAWLLRLADGGQRERIAGLGHAELRNVGGAGGGRLRLFALDRHRDGGLCGSGYCWDRTGGGSEVVVSFGRK
jgi:hypothetical protein